jgi:DNA polymerase (family 10)
VETGESRYLERLREGTPEGLLEMLRIPGLGLSKIRRIHEGLGIETVQALEEACRDGRVASLPKFGPKTAEKILRGISFLRTAGSRELNPPATAEGERLLALVRAHPAVDEAALAGSIRRHLETIGDVDLVAACERPAEVAASVARGPGVRAVVGAGSATVGITYVDGRRLDLHCVTPPCFAPALWRATGNDAHVAQVLERLAARGLAMRGDELLDARGAAVPVPDEAALYAAAGLAWVPPELREGRGEVEAAADGALPPLLTEGDIAGVLHCHSDYSDGSVSIEAMARAAMARGWRYLGISDHSESAFYAGGVKADAILRQHEEIDALNEVLDAEGFRVLKGIEADILQDGRVDYDERILARFDYVIGSVHSRFNMDGAAMTKRVLTALDSPFLTILGHPTGRLLLTREPYDLDVRAVLEKAAARRVAVELNADPHRLDLDWRMLREARDLGVTIEIGPDAHSPAGLDYMRTGVGIARKGWLRAADVLNTRSAEDVIAFARARRGG